MKTGLLEISTLEVEQATAPDFPVEQRRARLSLGRLESMDWVAAWLWTDGLRLLRFGIRVVLGAVLLPPLVGAFLLFCAAAICTDILARKKRWL